MTPLVDRVAVVVARHSPITGLGYSRTRCGCGEVFHAPFVKSHAAHVAEQIAELFTDPAQGRGSTGQVWTQDGAWAAVEENP